MFILIKIKNKFIKLHRTLIFSVFNEISKEIRKMIWHKYYNLIIIYNNKDK